MYIQLHISMYILYCLIYVTGVFPASLVYSLPSSKFLQTSQAAARVSLTTGKKETNRKWIAM